MRTFLLFMLAAAVMALCYLVGDHSGHTGAGVVAGAAVLPGMLALTGDAPFSDGARTCNVFVEDDGKWFNSMAYNFGLGGGDVVKMDFLSRARKFTAPEVEEIQIAFTATTLDGVTATAKGKDMPKLLKKLYFKDDTEMINVSGSSLRILEQIDFGSKQRDVADIASGATSSTYSSIIRLTFAPPSRAKRKRDFCVPLVNFLDGGEFSFQFADALPTGYSTVLGGKFKFFFKVREARTKELKARRKLSEVSYNRDDDSYMTDGAIRGLYLTSVLTTTGHTALTGITAVNSDNLELPPDMPPAILSKWYEGNSDAINSSTDEVIAGNVIPLVMPDRGQKIGAMPMLKSVHVRVGTVPTAAILLRDVLVERPMGLAMAQMGVDDEAVYARRLMNGTVSDGKDDKPVAAYNADLVRVMPVRFDRAA